MKNVRKICLVLAVGLVFSYQAYAGNNYNALVKAIRRDWPQLRMQELVSKIKGVYIRGNAYVVAVAPDASGTIVVTLCTNKITSHENAVTLVVYVRKNFEKIALKVKPGKKVYFSGLFQEIRMRTIVIDYGILR